MNIKWLIFYLIFFAIGSTLLLICDKTSNLIIAEAIVIMSQLGLVSEEIKRKIDQRFDALEKLLGK
jgi:hypothetical protein